MECPIPTINSDRSAIRTILTEVKTIAVMGLSPNPEKTSHKVAQYLQSVGYTIIPIYPDTSAPILGQTVYASLADVPASIQVDMVDVFRRSEHVPQVVEETIARGINILWTQIGVVHDEAAAKAQAAGLTVVQNKCTHIEHAAMVADGAI